MTSRGATAAKVEAQIARAEALNDRFRAFATITAEAARECAQALDSAAGDGAWAGVLHGMTVALKDNIDTAGVRTAAGSRMFEHHVPNADAPVVERLRRAGAVMLGKAALQELAFGIRSLDQVAGQVRNPWNPSHVPGGSSGGSAVAVALDLVDGALGTDTGGSVRIPASFCGVTGLRPTRGLVSNRGVLPLSVSLDTVGPMARRIEHVARLLFAMAGYDEADPTSHEPGRDLSGLLRASPDVSGLRIGVPGEPYFDRVDPDVTASVERFVEGLAAAGAVTVPIALPDPAEAHLHTSTILLCDACALHAQALDEPDRISPQVRSRMLLGRQRTGIDYARAASFRAGWVRARHMVFNEVDAIVMPASPDVAPPIDDGLTLEEATRHASRFTFGGSLAGTPALSLPVGISPAGLPIGVLVETAWWNEPTLVRIGMAWQQRTDWHLRRPPFDRGEDGGTDADWQA